MVRQALISVWDKTGVVELAQKLTSQGDFEVISSGGTFTKLKEANVPCKQVSDLTNFPEILDGRVKTLHPRIHGALLANTDLQSHNDELAKHGITPIKLVVVNLYPFSEAISRPNMSLEDCLEYIDIGGSALIRASAKNFPRVIVIVDPADYNWVAERFVSGGEFTLEERKKLAFKAFQHSSTYDAAISNYLAKDASESNEVLTATLNLPLKKQLNLRYGENPHQKAALYTSATPGGIAAAEHIGGPELSYNNILDADSALRCVREFSETCCAIIKHNNPCGYAVVNNDDQVEAYKRALAGDPVSAYGGIVAFNKKVTKATVEAMHGVFYEVLVAPDYDAEALEQLVAKRKKLRILRCPDAAVALTPEEALKTADLRSVIGGVLVQTADHNTEQEKPENWKLVTDCRKPTEEELKDLAFAWRVSKHVKSNAIVLVKNQAIVGLGCGQPNRLQSIHIALRVAGENAKGSVLASDAFMPFPDNVEMAVAGGISAIVQPGGSIRDEESIKKANEMNVPMLFTGVRHFKH
eukprot:GEZU01020962.1.p1 GENE.GEZU01020962.1~~GEZU01020962.1.p1  ORF type:complete len:526 (-),score=199.71 GEZU01020962.1:79-1656(-)